MASEGGSVAELRALLAEEKRQRADAERRAEKEAGLRADAERRAEREAGLRADAERHARAAEAALHEATDTPADLDATPYGTVLERLQKLVIASPSKASQAESALRPALAAFCLEEPLVLRGGPPREALRSAFEGVRLHGQENDMYSLATCCVPNCITAQERSAGAKKNAEALYGSRQQFELPRNVGLPLSCEPEVFTRVKKPGDPAYAAELKGLPRPTFNELATYTLLGIMDSCFRVDEGRRGRRFYAAPPVGYGLVAVGHCAYLVGFEWVGKLLMYPISHPFFLGSPQHKAAVQALDTTPLTTDGLVVLQDADGSTWKTYPPEGPPLVSWTHTPTPPHNRFWKVIESSAFDNHPHGGVARLRALFRVHAAYAAALATAADAHSDRPPPALVPACLRYGAFAVLVDMPFVGQRTADERHLANGGPVLDAIAAAVGWLARRSLLYIDLRAPNVRCDVSADADAQPDHTWLVDYDDMLLLPAPVGSVDELLAALASDEHGADALQAWPALEAALRKTWDWR